MENLSKQIDVLIPIIKERELNFKYFIMEFHKYRKIWEPKSAHKQNGQVHCSSDKEQKIYWTPSCWKNLALLQNNFLLLEMRVQ